MSDKLKKLFVVLFFVVCAASFLLLLCRKSPTELQLPSCPLRKFTGLYCPGCGSTRAIRRLLQGDFVGSLRYHPLVAPCLPLLAILFVNFVRDFFHGSTPYRRSTFYLGVFFLVAFSILFVLRNIPCAAFDFLRPPGGICRRFHICLIKIDAPSDAVPLVFDGRLIARRFRGDSDSRRFAEIYAQTTRVVEKSCETESIPLIFGGSFGKIYPTKTQSRVFRFETTDRFYFDAKPYDQRK